MTLAFLRRLFVRHAWRFGLGRITRHTRVLLTGLAWETRYEGVATIEFRHGIWESGEGHTDVLRFRVRGRTTPIEIDGLGLFGDNAGSSALGQVLAERVGVPYSAVTERIPDPASD